MITVTVEAWPFINELFGSDMSHRYVMKIKVKKDTTLEDLIEKLCKQKPSLRQVLMKSKHNELSGVSSKASIVLNGRLTNSTTDMATKVNEGDRIILVQGFAGG